MLASRLVFLTALAFFCSASASAGTQKLDKSSESTDLHLVFLNGTDQRKHVSTKVGQEIIVTLQTVGPGQYETPRDHPHRLDSRDRTSQGADPCRSQSSLSFHLCGRWRGQDRNPSQSRKGRVSNHSLPKAKLTTGLRSKKACASEELIVGYRTIAPG